ncbi:hypothetical protein BH18THE2_BH18THE2_14470 [soil metagenome]
MPYNLSTSILRLHVLRDYCNAIFPQNNYSAGGAILRHTYRHKETVEVKAITKYVGVCLPCSIDIFQDEQIERKRGI